MGVHCVHVHVLTYLLTLLFVSALLKTRAGTDPPQTREGLLAWAQGPRRDAQRHGWDTGSGRLSHYPAYCVPCVTDIYVLGACGRKEEMRYIITTTIIIMCCSWHLI